MKKKSRFLFFLCLVFCVFNFSFSRANVAFAVRTVQKVTSESEIKPEEWEEVVQSEHKDENEKDEFTFIQQNEFAGEDSRYSLYFWLSITLLTIGSFVAILSIFIFIRALKIKSKARKQ